MKKLTITYGDTQLFDGEVEEFNWSENPNGVKAEGRITAGRPNGGGGFMDMLSGFSRARTEQVADTKREELKAEKAEKETTSE